MRLTDVPMTSIDGLLERYEGLLLDSSGVLLHAEGAFAGASALIHRLNRQGTPYEVLSNDASRSPQTAAERLQRAGLPVPAAQVLTTGLLLSRWFRDNHLAGAHTVVLGTQDSVALASAGGAAVDAPRPDAPLDVLVIADEAGYPFVPWVDAALTQVARNIRRGHPVRIVLPNPDVVYVRGPGAVGVTAGGIAALISAALDRLLGSAAPRPEPLGKPYPPLFEAGLERLGTRDAVMIGDQLRTDVAGALGVGIHAALVGTGLTALDDPTELGAERTPTWRLQDLRVPTDKT